MTNKAIYPAGRHGFTLLETLIYIAVLSLLILFLVLVFYQILDSNRETRARLTVTADARFLMGKIEWALLGAQTINQPAAGGTSSVLSVSRYNFGQNPLVFDAASGTARLRRGSGQPAALTGSEVQISQMVFQNVAASGSLPAAVAVSFSVISLRQNLPVAVSTTLASTIYLRK